MSRGGRLELGTGLRWRDSIGLGLQWIGYHRARRSADSDAEETPGSGAAQEPARPGLPSVSTGLAARMCAASRLSCVRCLSDRPTVSRARVRAHAGSARRAAGHGQGGGDRAGRAVRAVSQTAAVPRLRDLGHMAATVALVWMQRGPERTCIA